MLKICKMYKIFIAIVTATILLNLYAFASIKPLYNHSNSILISAAGDCTLGNNDTKDYRDSFLQKFINQNKNYEYFFKNVKNIFKNDDLTIVNLETTLTTATKRMNKQYTFKGLPEYTNIIKAANIDAVNISNNHIHDYYSKGFNDTIDNLKNSNINFFGEGFLSVKTINGIKVGLAGYRGWTYDKYIQNQIKQDIKSLKNKGARLIIVSFHWGEESKYFPNKVQQKLGKYSIDCGADLVIGHHPHVIEGIEKYKNKFIIYSLGNFCFGGNRYLKDKDTFIFHQKFNFESNNLISTEASVIPCSISSSNSINNFQPTPMNGTDRAKVINRLNEYSKNFGTIINKDGTIMAKSKTYSEVKNEH